MQYHSGSQQNLAWAEGESLGLRLERGEVFSPQEVLQILIHTARALGQLHSQHKVYQQVTPWQIVWSPSTDHVRLLPQSSSWQSSPHEGGSLSLEEWERSWSYLSPEQTGRTPCRVDHRADFYAMGATAWHLLIGRPPFQSNEPQQLIHAHLAERPVPPHKIRSNIPRILSKIVLKLLAKHPEERYQSTTGLLADLQRCLDGLKEKEDVHFILGEYDPVLDLTHLCGLYGREREQTILQDLWEQTQSGASPLVLVCGEAGVGKSTLIHSLMASIYASRGHFASGRFEPLQGEAPYLAVQTALRSLLRGLLAEERSRLRFWQTRLAQSLGGQGGVLAPLLPELEHVVGSAFVVEQLHPQEDIHRIHRAFSCLFCALASPSHPLALFLDDLQWADQASLELLEFLATDPSLKSCLLIGSFRNATADASAGISLFLQSVQQRKLPVTYLVLSNLSVADVQKMLAEVMRCGTEQVHVLAAILVEKTAGNPFFMQVFWQKLLKNHLLWVDEQGWCWDSDTIRSIAVTDNVVSFLLDSLQHLSLEVQQVLQVGACLGHQLSVFRLAELLDWPQQQVALCLESALEAGLLHSSPSSEQEEPTISFVHDRVQEAAYVLVSEEERTASHLRIGRYLLGQTQIAERADVIYETVRHFQKGYLHVPDAQEQRQCACLAFSAGEHARRVGAFESAFHFFEWGLWALGDARWTENYELTQRLCCALIEVGMACPNRDPLERWVEELLIYGCSLVDQLPAWRAKIWRLLSEHRMAETVMVADHFSRQVGFPLPRPCSRWRMFGEMIYTLALLGRRGIEVFREIPKTEDPLLRGIFDIRALAMPAYQHVYAGELLPVVFWEVRDVVRYGLTGFNIQSLIGLGMAWAGGLGRIDQGIRIGELALELLDTKLQCPELWPRAALLHSIAVRPWSWSFSALAEVFENIFHRSLEFGDLFSAFAAKGMQQISMYHAGQSLDKVAHVIQGGEQTRSHYRHNITQRVSQLLHDCVLLLRQDQVPIPSQQCLGDPEPWKGILFGDCIHTTFQLHLCLLFGSWQTAFDLAIQKRKELRSPATVLFCGPFWTYALISMAYGQEQGWKFSSASQTWRKWGFKQLKTWIKAFPESRQYRLSWVEAAMLRSRYRDFRVIAKYDQALEQALQCGCVHDAALIAEHAAICCEQWGYPRMAKHFWQEALSHYEQWGAKAKVRHLQEKSSSSLPALLPVRSHHTPHGGIRLKDTGDYTNQLDFQAVLSALDAISRESNHRMLLQRLMRLAMEHSCAERGLLLLHRKESWLLAAEVQGAKADATFPDIPISIDEENQILSSAMLRYILLSLDTIVLADAAHDGPFVRDPYIVQAQPRSVLCFPILLHNQPIGMMYLENQMVAGVFTPDRQKLLHLIATQAAVSLQVFQTLSSTEMVAPRFERVGTDSHEWMAQPSPSSSAQAPGSHATLNEPLLQLPVHTDRPSSRRQELVGSQLGDWQILRKIAEGGMSLIYEANNVFTDQRAAIKLLAPHFHDQTMRLRRFEREARTLEQFDHPNIVQLLDFDTDPKYGPFMALEYLEGENLQTILERCAPVPLGWLLAVSEQICGALAEVHHKRILHRDLKPSNIFLCPGEPFPQVRLLDFGIVDVSGGSSESRLTSTGVIVGTPAYLAPEQLKQKESPSPATDLYALGVIWFEALTGNHPLGTGSSVEMFVKILQEEPMTLGQLRPEFRGTELEGLLSRLFSKNPKFRPRDIEELWGEFTMSCQFMEDPLDTSERYPQV